MITTHAFSLFLHHNDLRHRLDELLAQVRLDDWDRLVELSREMRSMIGEGEIPPEVQGEIHRRLEDSRRQGLAGSLGVAQQCLERRRRGVLCRPIHQSSEGSGFEATLSYKEVLASKYSPRALAYRLRSGLADQETPMAVLVLQMIEPAVSGVVYTWEPQPPAGEAPCLAIYAIPGLGASLVDGSTVPEVHYLSRERPPRLLAAVVSPNCPLESGSPGRGCLSPEAAVSLAGWGMTLEKLGGCPQDMEWCQDNHGRLFLLQSRPLKTGPAAGPDLQEAEGSPEIAQPVVLQGGITASPGLGMGKVWLVRREDELGEVPEGAVLVSSTLPPAFAGIIQRLRAVVTDGGSRASHFATVAREYGLPVLVGAVDATRRLTPGQVVTVDASHGRIYLGEVESLKKSRPGGSQAGHPLCHPAAGFDVFHLTVASP